VVPFFRLFYLFYYYYSSGALISGGEGGGAVKCEILPPTLYLPPQIKEFRNLVEFFKKPEKKDANFIKLKNSVDLLCYCCATQSVISGDFSAFFWFFLVFSAFSLPTTF